MSNYVQNLFSLPILVGNLLSICNRDLSEETIIIHGFSSLVPFVYATQLFEIMRCVRSIAELQNDKKTKNKIEKFDSMFDGLTVPFLPSTSTSPSFTDDQNENHMNHSLVISHLRNSFRVLHRVGFDMPYSCSYFHLWFRVDWFHLNCMPHQHHAIALMHTHIAQPHTIVQYQKIHDTTRQFIQSHSLDLH